MSENVTTAAETNLIDKDDMKRVRELDFTRIFEHKALAKLLEVIGVTRRIPMMEGTTLYVYKTTGTLQSGAVDEGAIIPLSEYEVTKTAVGSITLKKWRKATSAEAIMKSGYNEAVRNTDAAMLKDIQKDVRDTLFNLLMVRLQVQQQQAALIYSRHLLMDGGSCRLNLRMMQSSLFICQST
jgi:hypothetical protein